MNVNNFVDLSNKKLKYIIVKFNKVNSGFNYSDNELESLEGCPEFVRSYFTCCNNKLATLKGCPKKVYGNLNVSNNKLESLENCSVIVEGNFNCSENKLISLKGCPKLINGFFDCSYNQLKILKYAPETVEGDFYCNNNQLTSLSGFPNLVRNMYSHDNKLDLRSLKYLPKKIKTNHIEIYNNEKLKDLQNITNFKEFKIKVEKEKLLNIINKEKLNKKSNVNKV